MWKGTITVRFNSLLKAQWCSGADPGFPVGGANVRNGPFSAKTIWAPLGEHAPGVPRGSANGTCSMVHPNKPLIRQDP